MTKAPFPLLRSLRLTAISRRLLLALGASSIAFSLLLVHVFLPMPGLQVAALILTGFAFIAAWTAVLCWRMPVFSASALWGFTAIWLFGLLLAVALVLLVSHTQMSFSRQVAVQWLAFSISLSVGGLQFRALFHRRATPVLGRFLSWLSPIAVVLLILTMSSY